MNYNVCGSGKFPPVKRKDFAYLGFLKIFKKLLYNYKLSLVYICITEKLSKVLFYKKKSTILRCL